MYGTKDTPTSGPMWWPDVPTEAAKANFREDFFELTRLLNQQRERYEPLRHGDFKPVLLDEKRRILAFARTMPGHEVVLVMNYGQEKQRVTLPAHWPGQMVGLLSPQIRPAAGRDSTLRIGGSRQQADEWGDVTFWVNPASVRLMLIDDDATWSVTR